MRPVVDPFLAVVLAAACSRAPAPLSPPTAVPASAPCRMLTPTEVPDTLFVGVADPVDFRHAPAPLDRG